MIYRRLSKQVLFVTLLNTIRWMCSGILIRKKIIFQGIVVMSEAIEEVFVAFLNNKVPNMWHRKGYNSLKSLGSWIVDLTMRVDFIEVTI